MKKVICILLSVLLTVCLIGCDKKKTDDSTFQAKETSGEGSLTQESTETTDGSSETDKGDDTADSEATTTDSGETTDESDENNGWTNIY